MTHQSGSYYFEAALGKLLKRGTASEDRSPMASDELRKLDWNLLRVFSEIARAGGVSEAARKMGRKQPAVSLALKRLEAHLGAKLCERGPAGFRLTEEGEFIAA